ncbi:MAG: hypothetical protein ABI867_27250, partial [Kofleriaceae bacterium]
RVARSTPASAECSVDDTPCYESEKGFFGSCVSGTCQPRCVTAQDCELADRALGGTIGGSLDATCQWTCRALPRSRAGVCERL